jgi:uncharacterized membrane protein YphA (DoxX/SURF4 family)
VAEARALPAVVRPLLHPATVRACQVVTGVLLGVAALAKLGDLPSFAVQIHNFRILPVPLENLAAVVLPWVELVAALSLVLGVRRRAGAVVATGLLAVFTLAVAAALARGLDIECGCFGTADASRVGLGKLLQNLALLAVAWVGTLEPR